MTFFLVTVIAIVCVVCLARSGYPDTQTPSNKQNAVEYVLSKPLSSFKHKNDIVDFTWFIPDTSKEREDCKWRDTMLLRNIQKEMTTKKRAHLSKQLTPPLFDGCQCRLDPVFKKDRGRMAREDREAKQDFKEFDEWLDEKGKQE